MSTVAVPQFSQAQARRLERARLRRQLKEGRISLAEALEHPALQTLLVFDLLTALPSWRGPRCQAGKEVRKATALAQSLYAHIQRGGLTRVEDLTGRERELLVSAYRRYMEERVR